MMSSVIDTQELRKFGIILATGMVVLFALLPYLFHQSMNTWPLVASASILLVAQLKPTLLKWIYHPWMKLGHCLGWINTRIILGIIFFLLITPIGFIRKLLGKDAMERAFEPNVNSYRKKSVQHSASQMEKPY